MSGLFYNAMLKLDSIPTTVDGHLHLENINIGVMTTVLGVVIVFLVLVAICLLLAIFAILVKDKNKQNVPKAPAPKPAPAIIPVKTSATAAPVQSYVDDKELVAVITAAIAATMGSNTDGFVVRRIRRVGNWNQEAIEQQQNSLY